jgi:signal transduction histidine kinase
MKGTTLQVLLVEDNAGDARLLREMFRKEKRGSFELIHVLRLAEALAVLANNEIDIVLLDLGLPDGHGLDTVQRVHAVAPDVPVIVLTGLDDEALAAGAMKAGAQDYLIKGQIENRALPRVLRHAIERHRMLTEAELLRTQQIQFKDEFLSHVSHELRSPLTAIYQFVTILLDGLAGKLNPEQFEYLGIVLTNVTQLRSMIDDLLEVTRVQAGKLLIDPQRTSIADAIEYTINTLQGAAAVKGIALSVDVHEGLPSMCADPTRVRQILIILVDNAIKFTPAGGSVRVTARLREEFADCLVLEIADSGCGISPDMTERIFERLFQASDPASAGRKGLGLGLYICKELATRQGGQIWATSEPGKGSVFSVTLPIYSLPNLIAPAFRGARPHDGPMTLVVAELASQTGWLSDQLRAEHSQAVRALIQSCLHSDLDILLPRMGSAGAAELFFIVVLTDAIGGEAIAKRIREQLGGSGNIQQAGSSLSTWHQPLEPIKREVDESAQTVLERAANHIQKHVDEKLASKAQKNAQ